MKTLPLLDRPGPDGHTLLAPTVGRYHGAPPLGTFLSPGAPAGVLRVLAVSHRLVVPEGVSGFVTELLVERGPARLEYGQPLLRLGSGAVEGLDAGGPGEAARTGETDIPEGMLALRSPTDGIFYRRPSPEQPPFVTEGDVVSRGKVVALVEVMKCFSRIVWSPSGDGPDRARIARILPDDAAEVKLGQPLFLLEPV